MTDRNDRSEDGEMPRVCVHGLGYVGLPTAAILANTGYDVVGFDVDPEHRRNVTNGRYTFDEPELERFVDRALETGLTISGEVVPAEFHIICVPTPYHLDLDRTDLSYVEAAGEAIADQLRTGDAVVLSSTVPPGTTAGPLREIIEQTGLSVISDVLLAYSPETVLPGNTLTELRGNDRLVGTVEGRPADRIVALYDSFVDGDIRTTNATTAEFVKLVQNAYRDVNIAFANEVAKLAHEFGTDSRRSIALANEHPRVNILDPGPGVGGHCIPIDPLFLNHENDVPMLIETARRVNDGMVSFVTTRLREALGDLHGVTVAILGVAYKGGVADTRESPSLSLVNKLESENVETVRVTDPYVSGEVWNRELLSLEACLDDSDAAVIVTDHPEYGELDPAVFAERMSGRTIVDTRAILDDAQWEATGFDVHTI